MSNSGGWWRPLVCTALIGVVGGCAVGPDYKQPETTMPLYYRGEDQIEAPATDSFADLTWREVFDDPLLQDLIKAALANNYDLRQALARVDQSRALVRQARAGFFPNVGYQGTIGRGRNAVLGQATPAQGQMSTSVLGAINASWEIDLWGRVRRLDEAAQAQLLGTEAATRAVGVLLVAEVAAGYYQLRSLDTRHAIASEAVQSYADSLELFRFRYEGGVASLLDVYSAEGAMEQARALRSEIEREITVQENALSILIGAQPQSITRNAALLVESPPGHLPSGLPSQLLTRRFDVQQAEATLRAATAQIGVAEAEFFPQLNLTGLLGRVSSDLSGVTAGSSNAWSVAAGLAGPIFEGGFLRGQLQQAEAVEQEAVANYQQVVLQSLGEVADQLITQQKLTEIRQSQRRAVSAYRKAVDLSFQRYRNGLADYLDVLQAQQGLFPSEDSLAQTVFFEWLTVIQLYRSLGGGWNDPSILSLTANEETDH